MEAVANKEKLPTRYKNVASVISVGKENAILLNDILSLTGINDKRHGYEIIENLIIQYGFPIIASKKSEHRGYYLPANKDELIEAKITLRNTINSLEKRYKALGKNYKEYQQQ